MTLDDYINRASIILPEHKKEFASYLKKLPSGIEKWLYGTPDNQDSLYQGDILIDLPVCFIDEDGDVVKGIDIVAMISNACDMQIGRRETVIASPIITFSEYEKHLRLAGEKNINDRIMDIRHNNIFSRFYLPQAIKFPESFIDFSKMVTINSTYANREYPEQRLLSLSQYGFYFFLIKLTFHFARMEYPSNQN